MTHRIYFVVLLVASILYSDNLLAQTLDSLYRGLEFRNVGPYRGGRSVAIAGTDDPLSYYMGSTGGGVWKTTDAGINWDNVSDGFLESGSVGAISVAPSDPNIIYVGMGEHPVRGVMTSHGDGMYKSMDGGMSWTHLGLDESRHIAEIRIHPTNPDIVYVAVQGALYGDSSVRGIFRSIDGGISWKKVLYVDASSGAADLSMDYNNPRILYASFWDHRRKPWLIRSGGPGSAIYKSKDGGENWQKLSKGLPQEMGKIAVDVSRANSNVVYANIEAEGKQGGVYRSDDGGESWKQTTNDRVTVARAWYYIEIFADPTDENTVYVLNAPMLKSIDGGKSFQSIPNPHGDQHDMWINPSDPDNIALANDGGACITFNGGKSWSSQQNQPTAQFYRVITDRQVPYHIYGGQQDNTSVIIASRSRKGGISWKDWVAGPGCESAFLAFDPDNPSEVFGTCIQGGITAMDMTTGEQRDVMADPIIGLGWTPADMKYRYNWNNPLVADLHNPDILYHGAQMVLRSDDRGYSWSEISPDLTRNDKSKQNDGGVPFTNEGAGGEVYNTISYIGLSPHNSQVIWTGSDCGLVHLTQDGGSNWDNVTPSQWGEVLINCIEVSPHDPSWAFIVATNYKFEDLRPMVYMTKDNGQSWQSIHHGLPANNWTRAIREDRKRAGLLYLGTENGLFVSNNYGQSWSPLQLNLPRAPITDLTIADNDLVIATSGRSFWILDDLSSIQQQAHNSNNVLLVTPKNSYRIMSGGGLRPGEKAGKNPPNGVILDYFLPQDVDSATLTLTITKGDDIIRQYSSRADQDYKKYIGGPKAEKTLTTNTGLNRFVWDMRHELAPGVDGIFMLGSYAGIYVPPGDYQAKLAIDDKIKSEVNFKILSDPHVKATQQDYDHQYKELLELQGVFTEIHQNVRDVKRMKKQLIGFCDAGSTDTRHDTLYSIAQGIIEKMDQWESTLIQKEQKTFQDVINFPNRLNAEIANLISTMSSAHPKLTKGMMNRKAHWISQWQQSNDQLTKIKADIIYFNTLFKELSPDLISVE